MLATRCRLVAGIGLSSIYSVPQNLIIPFNSLTIPSGYERFDELDNRHPVGAGSTYSLGSTGGNSGDIYETTSTDGYHSGSSDITAVLKWDLGGSTVYYTSYGNFSSSGSHSHNLTGTYVNAYQNLIFIKATQPHIQFPPDAIVFGKTGTTPIVGLSNCYAVDRVLRGSSSIATGGGSVTGSSCSYSGTHGHTSTGTIKSDHGGDTGYTVSSAGSHNHTTSISVSSVELKRAYLTAWTKTSAFSGAAGIIAMWQGTTPPPGWKLCNGTDGTIDLRDYFIMLSSLVNAGTSYNESNRRYLNLTINSTSWSHSHKGSFYSSTVNTGTGHDTYDAAHGHTITSLWQNHTPLYYALTFVEKA